MDVHKSTQPEDGGPTAPKLQISKKISTWHHLKPAISVIAFIFGVIIAASCINAFVFQSYYVEGSSMQPTLHDNDRLIVGKTNNVVADLQGEPFIPSRGDIVVLLSDLPNLEPLGRSERLIKRVIGLPGEHIEIKNGNITIFNHQHSHGFKPDKTLHLGQLAPTFSARPISVQLAKDEIFVVGDNRGPGGSLDSRSFGPVDIDRVKGVLWMRVFPLSDIKLF